jgi:hypothetical protein
MAPADLAAAHAISTTVVVEQHSHQLQSSHLSAEELLGGSNDDGLHTEQQLASKQQHSPAMLASAAPAQADPALLSSAAPEHGHLAVQQHAQQQQQQQDQQQQQSSSEDDSWTPGQPQSSGGNANAADADLDDDEETWDPNGPPPQYCTNCTARLYQPPTCSDCGHSSDQDDSLFEAVSSADALAGTAATADGRPLIIWDDELLLHEEGKAVPHPERPDRLRAIMARLVGNGLAGAPSSSSLGMRKQLCRSTLWQLISAAHHPSHGTMLWRRQYGSWGCSCEVAWLQPATACAAVAADHML